jgi:hypothetical protein
LVAVIFFVIAAGILSMVPTKFTGKKYWIYLFFGGAGFLLLHEISQVAVDFEIITPGLSSVIEDFGEFAGGLALALGAYLLYRRTSSEEKNKKKIMQIINLAKVKHAKHEISEKTYADIIESYERQLLELESAVKELD